MAEYAWLECTIAKIVHFFWGRCTNISDRDAEQRIIFSRSKQNQVKGIVRIRDWAQVRFRIVVGIQTEDFEDKMRYNEIKKEESDKS